MKHRIHRYLLLFGLLLHTPLSAISIVYNFRIAQITKQPLVETPRKQNHTFVTLLFDQYQQKYEPVNQNFVGGLGSYIFGFSSNYIRADFAVSHIKEHTKGITTFSGTETDDFLITLGHNFRIKDKTSLTLSGLFGFPTHDIHTLQHVDFGYGQFSAGLQLDGSTNLHHDNALIYGARYIYLVPRHACDNVGESHKFTIGNDADLLFAYKQYWHKHGIELGYTSRFDFGAHVCPSFDDIVEKTNYIRSNFYFVYKYKFHIRNVAHRFLFNLSYGLDHKPKIYGNKFIITLWTSWDVNF